MKKEEIRARFKIAFEPLRVRFADENPATYFHKTVNVLPVITATNVKNLANSCFKALLCFAL
jgi:hypothetical protein